MNLHNHHTSHRKTRVMAPFSWWRYSVSAWNRRGAIWDRADMAWVKTYWVFSVILWESCLFISHDIALKEIFDSSIINEQMTYTEIHFKPIWSNITWHLKAATNGNLMMVWWCQWITTFSGTRLEYHAFSCWILTRWPGGKVWMDRQQLSCRRRAAPLKVNGSTSLPTQLDGHEAR